MATSQDIINIATQRKTGITQGLANLGNSVVGILKQRAQKDKLAQTEAAQLQAADLLGQAASAEGPEGEALFNQAFQLAPRFVSSLMQSRKLQAQSLTEADKVGLRSREADLREGELIDRQEERALKKEALTIKNLQQSQKLKVTEAEAEKEQAGISSSIDSSLDLVTRMLEDKGLDKAVGLSSILPTLPGSSASDFEALHEQLSGQNFLQSVKQMTGMGSLSDAEGKKLAAAAEALSLNQSPAAYRAALNRIKKGLATRKEAGFYTNDTTKEETPKAIKWDDL